MIISFYQKEQKINNTYNQIKTIFELYMILAVIKSTMKTIYRVWYMTSWMVRCCFEPQPYFQNINLSKPILSRSIYLQIIYASIYWFYNLLISFHYLHL